VKYKPAAAPRAIADNTSIGVCASVHSDEANASVPFMYSEYNLVRGIPNFVAFQVFDYKTSDRQDMGSCRDTWKNICSMSRTNEHEDEAKARCRQIVDRGFGQGKLVRNTCGLEDVTCKQGVEVRGHMNPASFNIWDKERCRATMSYINAFPSRSGFDGGPWASREAAVLKYLKRTRAKGKSDFLWMAVGVSTESDGEILSLRQFADSTTKSTVDVPKFVWSAVFDPRTKTSTGWMCRNGLTARAQCHCIDKLSVHQLQRHVGFKIFPHLEGVEGVDLSNSSNDVFWEMLQQ